MCTTLFSMVEANVKCQCGSLCRMWCILQNTFQVSCKVDLGSGPLLRMAGYSSLQGHCTFSMLIISSNCIEVYKYFACFTSQKDIKHPMKESHYMCKKSGSQM